MAKAQRDFAFFQVIGTGFHQDALSDGQTVEEIINRYREWHPAVVRQASETAHRLLSENHDEAEMEAILEGFGFSFLVEPLGFAGYNAFVRHLAERLDGFIADRPAQAFVIPEPEPMRELADREIDALSVLLTDNFGAGFDEEYTDVLGRWSARQPAGVLRDARSAANALREGPLLEDEMTALLEDMGLGYDLWEWDHLGLTGFLEAISNELSRALGEPLQYDEVFEAPSGDKGGD